MIGNCSCCTCINKRKRFPKLSSLWRHIRQFSYHADISWYSYTWWCENDIFAFNPNRKSENETIEMLPFAWFRFEIPLRVVLPMIHKCDYIQLNFSGEKNSSEKPSGNLFKNKNWNIKKFRFCTWHLIFRLF